MKVRNKSEQNEITLDMTSMIDVVFQLLIFFIMTFKIVELEGDFNIKMPLAAPSAGMPDTPLPPLLVRMRSDSAGNLAQVTINDKPLPGSDWFGALRSEVIGIVGPGSGGPSAFAEGAEVELDVDYNLKYNNVIRAITAVTGYRGPDGTIQKLVEKVKFAKPHEPGG